MLNTASGPLPRHLYCFADKAFTRTGGTGFEPCVWFGLISVPGRMWGCHVLLECGAIYRALPPHALAFTADAPAWGPQDAQEWDCYGVQWSGLVYPYLDGLRLSAKCGDLELPGEYLFTSGAEWPTDVKRQTETYSCEACDD